MGDDVWLTERFEEHRGRLKSVASRMLGSPTEADDAVQEAWLRFSRSDTSGVENLGSWLTTVVSRVCLNMLQRRRTRSELNLDPEGSQSKVETLDDPDPEGEALLADSVGLALLIVLDGLEPPERVAFVLHDMFVFHSMRSPRSLDEASRRHASSQAEPDAGCEDNLHRIGRIGSARRLSSRRFSPPHVAATSRRYSRSLIQTSFCAPTPRLWTWARSRKPMVRRRLPHSVAGRGGRSGR